MSDLWGFGVPGKGVVLDNLDLSVDEITEQHCVLLSTGSLNPPHFGHVDIMVQASSFMQKSGFNVLHAYIRSAFVS